MAQLLDIRSSDMGPRDFLVKWADGEEDSWVRPASWLPVTVPGVVGAATGAAMPRVPALLTRPSLLPSMRHQAAASADGGDAICAHLLGGVASWAMLCAREHQYPMHPGLPSCTRCSHGRTGPSRLLAGEGD